MFTPSKYQQDIASAIQAKYAPRILGMPYRNGNENIMIDAVAGSGKTTTLKWIINDILPPTENVLAIAFNKDISVVLAQGLPNATVKTYHALGLSAIKGGNRNSIRVANQSQEKTRMILKSFLDYGNWGGYYAAIARLVSVVKNLVIEDLSDDTLFELAMSYGVDVDESFSVICDAVRRVVDEAARMTSYIDFDDMIWFPAIFPYMKPKQYDAVFVDELQDTNLAQGILIRNALAPGGYIVGVGDPFQSIYAFRGADTNAMPQFATDFHAKTMPLSITYRNPLSVVQYVNTHFPDIKFEAAETAIQGEIKTIDADQMADNLQPGDAVLCRLNAPLVPKVFEQIRRGRKANIRGRDIGDGLKSLVKRMKAEDVGDLMGKLVDYRDGEVYKLNRAEKELAAQNLEDRVETVIQVATSGNCKTVDDVLDRIDTIFAPDVSEITFSSGHRAKGLEFNNVYVIEPQLMGNHRRCKTPEQCQQEDNLHYVTATRAKQTLNFVQERK